MGYLLIFEEILSVFLHPPPQCDGPPHSKDNRLQFSVSLFSFLPSAWQTRAGGDRAGPSGERRLQPAIYSRRLTNTTHILSAGSVRPNGNML